MVTKRTRVNVVTANLSGLSSSVLNKVFQTQCCHFYGAHGMEVVRSLRETFRRSVQSLRSATASRSI